MTVSPVETAKAIDMPFREWTRVGRRNYIRWVYVSPREGVLLRGMTTGFSCMLPSTISSGSNIRIIFDAVDSSPRVYFVAPRLL